MNELQKHILKVAKEIHNICVQNNIEYFMLGGTFLGAVRHKGFIPWDDDIDFGMTLPNYKKFIEVINSLNHSWLTFDIPSVKNKEYSKLYIKAYDKNTTLIEEQRNDCDARGVFVDIFPIGYAANTYNGALIYWKYYNFWRSLLDRKQYILHKDPSFKDTFLNIVSHLFSRDFLITMSLTFVNKTNKRKDYMIYIDGFRNEIVKSHYYETPYILYNFEDTQFYGFSDYDNYLTEVFHNYMEFPPVEKRISVHAKYVNLNLPYAQYLQGINSK